MRLIRIAVSVFSLFWGVSGAAALKTLKVGFADAPPYADEKTKDGFEIELMRETLKLMDYDIEVQIFSRARNASMLKKKLIDASSVGDSSLVDEVDGFYAQRCVPYYDFFLSKKSRGLKLARWEDLQKLRIIGFQSAKNIAGPQFKKYAVEGNPNYLERPDQINQPLMLYSDRVDLSFGDANIFNFLAQRVKHIVDISPELVYTDLSVDIKNYQYSRPIFLDKAIRDKFNNKLHEFKKSGRYQELFAKWHLRKAPVDSKNGSGYPF